MDIQLKKVSKSVLIYRNEYWDWFLNKQEPSYVITGKYLFFCEDRDVLRKIVIDEIENNGFHHGKINLEGKQMGKDYVLCLYYKDDSRKYELFEKYKEKPDVKYRYWKSDKDTLKGKYSKEFISNLSPNERKKWTRSKI